MNEETPNTTVDHPELLRHAHRAMHEALQAYAAGLQGLTVDDIARLLIGSSASVVAATLGPAYASELLRSMADNLAAPADAVVN